MTIEQAMRWLDCIVEAAPPARRYDVALGIYAAVHGGAVACPVPLRTLYEWVLKWALLPSTREATAG